ncbi:hypothetical protein ACFQV2_24375 [Actinokineospora soli]|uniref:Uncharacterized protein n=1 Tax=Actinokineospora soli TaxID=1048753 RepID=A0ABW2TQQ7_9PSEU
MTDYPIPAYDPMADTALTDAERWPALSPAARRGWSGSARTPTHRCTTTRAVTG